MNEKTQQQRKKGDPRHPRTATKGKFVNLKQRQGNPYLYYVRRSDSLIYGITLAFDKKRWKGKSFKTRYNHIQEAELFVRLLRWSGYGVRRWTNINNKHVQTVVDIWIAKGLSPSTLKEYMSGVRSVLDYYGNKKVNHDNFTFNLPRRKYILNEDKSLDQVTFNRIIQKLACSNKKNDERFLLMLKLQRYLGLRLKESILIRPANTLLADGSARITYGTKGGRERTLPPQAIMPEAKQALESASKLIGGFKTKNLIFMEEDLRAVYTRFLNKMGYLGLTKQNGATSHGNRHWFVQTRYKQMSGLIPPCKFDSQEDFQIAAYEQLENDWPKADQIAREYLKIETGHGPDRDDVMSQYLGSGGKAKIVNEEAFIEAYTKKKSR